MAHFVAVIIVIGICIGFAALIYLGAKRNWNLPKDVRRRIGNKVAVGGFVLYLLLKCFDSYVANMDSEAKVKRAEDVFQQAVALMGQSAELKECKRRLEAGEFKTHVSAYVNCQEPLVIEAFKNSGVRHNDSLQSIADIWQEMLVKADKGETIAKEDFARNVIDIIRRDEAALK